MADARLQVVIEAVNKASGAFRETISDLGRVQQAQREVNRDFNEGLRQIRNVGLGLTAFGATGVVALKQVGDAAIQNHQAMAQLQVAVTNAGQNFQAMRGSIEQTTQALQRSTNFGVTEQTRALALMTATLGDSILALKALPVAMDIAAATGNDLGTTAIQLSRVLSGQQETIRGVGVDFTKATDATGKLELAQKSLGGTAQAVVSPFAQLSNQFANLKQKLGEDAMPAIVVATNGLKTFMAQLEHLPSGLVGTGAAIAVLGISFASTTGPMLLFLSQLPKLRTEIMAVGAALTTFATGPLGLAVLGIGAVTAATILLGHELQKVRPHMEAVFGNERAGAEKLAGPFAGLARTSRTPPDFGTAAGRAEIEAADKLFDAQQEAAKLTADAIGQFRLAWSEATKTMGNASEMIGATSGAVAKQQSNIMEVIDALEFLGRDTTFVADQMQKFTALGLENADALKLLGIQIGDQLTADLEKMAASFTGGTERLAEMQQAGLSLADMFKVLGLEVQNVQAAQAAAQVGWKTFQETLEAAASALEKPLTATEREALKLDALMRQLEKPMRIAVEIEKVEKLASFLKDGIQLLGAMRDAGFSTAEMLTVLNAKLAELTKSRSAFELLAEAVGQVPPGFFAMRDAAASVEDPLVRAAHAGGELLGIFKSLDEVREATLRAQGRWPEPPPINFMGGVRGVAKGSPEDITVSERERREVERVAAGGSTLSPADFWIASHGGMINPWTGAPRMPSLQHGGFVMHPTIAKIGEAGPEAIIPLSHSAQLPRNLSIAENKLQPITVNVIVDGQIISSSTGKRAEDEEQVRSS